MLLRLIESHATLGRGPNLTNLVIQIGLEAGAVLQHDRVQVLGDESSLIGKTFMRLAKDVRSTQSLATMGGALLRNETMPGSKAVASSACSTASIWPRGASTSTTCSTSIMPLRAAPGSVLQKA